MSVTKRIGLVKANIYDRPLRNDGKYRIVAVDYDGTILKQEYLNEGDTFILPDPPQHEKLSFQEWTSTSDITNNTVTVEDEDIAIGAIYETKSGKTEIDITLTKVTGLAVNLYNITNYTSIDWGDGTVNSDLSHTYANYGDYTISIAGNIDFSGQPIHCNSVGLENFYIKEVRLKSGIDIIGNYAFNRCKALERVSIPNSVTSIGGGAFAFNYCLAAINLSNVSVIGNSLLHDCFSLKSFVFSNDVIRFNISACNNSKSLNIISSLKNIGIFENQSFYCSNLVENIVLPNVNTLGSASFYLCYSIKTIKISGSFTSILDNTFNSLYKCIKYDFTELSSVPTLSNTNAFYSINRTCKIYVPDALYDSWKAETNWSNFANYIYKASEMPDE